MLSDEASLSDEEYLRYGRQLMLAEIGEEGQVRLKAKSVLIVGLGGLGSAFFGWLADKTSIEFIFRISTLLPLLGIITGFLPNIEGKTTNT